MRIVRMPKTEEYYVKCHNCDCEYIYNVFELQQITGDITRLPLGTKTNYYTTCPVCSAVINHEESCEENPKNT